MTQLDIIFRSCTKDNPLGPPSRYIQSPKRDLTITCLKSVIASMEMWNSRDHHQDLDWHMTLHLLEDQSPEEDREEMRRILANSKIDYVWHDIFAGSQPRSMSVAWEYCYNLPGEMLYILDDDYLHKPIAMTELVIAYTNITCFLQSDAVLSSCDHHCYYKPSDVVPGIVLLGHQCHWKSTNATTNSVLISKPVFRKYRYLYDMIAMYDGGRNGISEITTINRAYSQVPAFHPLPSISAHVSWPDTAIPFFDHNAIWDMYQDPK